jgi:hypothetical protein
MEATITIGPIERLFLLLVVGGLPGLALDDSLREPCTPCKIVKRGQGPDQQAVT